MVETSGTVPGAGTMQNQQGRNTPTDDTPTGENQTSNEVISLSKEEFDKKLQAEADRRVTEALKTAKAKWEKEYNERLKQEKEEAARMSQLSEKEKQEMLLKKREEELAKKERMLHIQSLKLESIKILEEKKLPTSFVDWLIGNDADETYQNIQTFEKAFQEAVQEEVQRRLPKRIPKVGESKQQNPAASFDAQIRAAAGRRK